MIMTTVCVLRVNAEGECREVLVEGACRESRGVEAMVRVALGGSMTVLSSDTHQCFNCQYCICTESTKQVQLRGLYVH